MNIITGIRRCGKSTLMMQVLQKHFDHALFLNFEDPRLSGFVLDDFKRLDKEIETPEQVFYFSMKYKPS